VSLLVESLNCITVPMNENLSLRLYRDNRPNCLETASLQKGLVLVYKGKELIEEGIGFGVPIIKNRDKTFFSSKAQVKVLKEGEWYGLEKRFLLDTVSRKRFYKVYVNDNFYKIIHKLFEKAYLGHNNLLSVNNKLMELRETLKIKTDFEQVTPKGVVTVKYTCKENAIEITVDFSSLRLKECLELLVLNEQGANNFGYYSDANGLRLVGSKIGAWDRVNAKHATLTNANGSIAFSLVNIGSAGLFRGWEKTRNRFSWAGLSYSIHPSASLFDYNVRLNFR
jgi:hypothetical protein